MISADCAGIAMVTSVGDLMLATTSIVELRSKTRRKFSVSPVLSVQSGLEKPSSQVNWAVTEVSMVTPLL